jgi:hypothetical protein
LFSILHDRFVNNPSLNAINQISIYAQVKVNVFYGGPCYGNWMIMKGDDFSSGFYTLLFDDNYYKNAQNCNITTPDTIHQNFRGLAGTQKAYTTYVEKNRWYNVAYTYDGASSKLYVDCVLVDSAKVSNLTFTNNNYLFIGRLNSVPFPS